MRGVFWSLRRTAMVGVAIGSIVGAGAMVWMLQVGHLGTAHLLVILALFILPVATFAAWYLDRKHKRDTPHDELFETPEGIEVIEDEPPARAEDARDSRRVHEPHRRRRTERVTRM